MSAKLDMRAALDRFGALKEASREYEQAHPNNKRFRELELHDAALAYAAAVRKVARAKRDS